MEALTRWMRGPKDHQVTTTIDPGIETAWRIHGAVAAWTTNVDQKASFALAIESAVLVAVAGFTKKGSLFGSLEGQFEITTFALGIFLLIAGVVCAGNVVKPRLRGRAASREWPDHFIYFGHVRHWSPEGLAAKLSNAELLPALSQLLVAMSDIAWRKHRGVQASLWLAFAGFVTLSVCAWANR
ncbi:MAG: Pycsar system effector family protein [Nocardioides sp.]